MRFQDRPSPSCTLLIEADNGPTSPARLLHQTVRVFLAEKEKAGYLYVHDGEHCHRFRPRRCSLHRDGLAYHGCKWNHPSLAEFLLINSRDHRDNCALSCIAKLCNEKNLSACPQNLLEMMELALRRRLSKCGLGSRVFAINPRNPDSCRWHLSSDRSE